jgi:hypothetical protein
MTGMNNPKFALLIAEPHTNNRAFLASEAWGNFVMNLPRTIPPTERTERIAENVWLISLESELTVLSKLIDMLRNFSIPIRVLFFEDAPDWIRNPPTATPAAATTPS